MASRTLRSRKQILPSSTQLRGWHTIAPVTFTNNELDLESGEMRGQLPPKRKSTRQGQDPTSFKKQRIQTSSSMTEVDNLIVKDLIPIFPTYIHTTAELILTINFLYVLVSGSGNCR